ncbi:unnamed protein product [Prorocentrum cordatum]|uniref:Protein-tyrosine sulfotransferase n=1 Tax=Prorocentrum cordatum TaxID=2364126 RepID=A0ABN9TPE5_9DINO|nr:unnamed protein product [Polarella glacialis]
MRTALRADPNSRAVFMYCGLRTHLTIVLARPDDLQKEQPQLYDKLEAPRSSLRKYRAGSAAFEGLSAPQRVALSWLKRVLFGLHARGSSSGRVLALLMQDFLDDPAERLAEAAAFLGLALARPAAEEVAAGPVFRQYAKDFGTPWNATVQRQMLAGRARVYGAEVRAGRRLCPAAGRRRRSPRGPAGPARPVRHRLACSARARRPPPPPPPPRPPPPPPPPGHGGG